MGADQGKGNAASLLGKYSMHQAYELYERIRQEEAAEQGKGPAEDFFEACLDYAQIRGRWIGLSAQERHIWRPMRRRAGDNCIRRFGQVRARLLERTGETVLADEEADPLRLLDLYLLMALFRGLESG